jgi:hypothetical protein
MKLLFENWRKFLLNEGMSAALQRFKICYQATGEDDDLQTLVDEPVPVGWQARESPPKEHDCLRDFKKVGRGAFRAVYTVPDNSEIVLKIARPMVGAAMSNAAIASNREETELGRDSKYIEFMPKVYDVADDYSWIVAQKVTPLGAGSYAEVAMKEFFPAFFSAAENRLIVLPGHARRVSNPLYRGEPRSEISHLIDIWAAILMFLAKAMAKGQTPFTPLRGSSPEEVEYVVPEGIIYYLDLLTEKGAVTAGGARIREILTQSKEQIIDSLKKPGLMHRLAEFAADKKLSVSDFRADNLGYVTENGKKRFVVLDPVVRLEQYDKQWEDN